MVQVDTADGDIAGHLERARQAQLRGDSKGAARHLEQILAKDANHPAALNSLGMLALAREDLSAAQSYFARACAADPEAPALWVNLATAHRRQNDTVGEAASLRRVLEIDRSHLTANIRLAELHERLGEMGAAMQRWGAVAAIGGLMSDPPAELLPLFKRAEAFVEEWGRKFGEAIDNGLAQVRAEIELGERKRFDACVDVTLGRRRIYVNECAGLHFPFLPAEEFFDRSHFPWLGEIEAHTDAIRDEVSALIAGGLEGFSPYVDMEAGIPANKWSPLDKSLDWSAYFLWHFGEKKEEACRRCPKTAEAVASLPLAKMPRRAPTVFFSILRPKTRLPAHSGVSNARTIIHLPLIVPPGCGFRVGGEVREWEEGKAFAFDDTIEHEAWNDSDQLRAVLIFDVWNPYLTEVERKLLAEYFTVADNSGFNPDSGAIAD